MRILGIDYGDKRTGLALSDTLEILASPLKTILNQSMRKDIDIVAEIAKDNNVERIVLGLPLNMDGSEGERANKTRAFGRNLEKVSGINVVYQDERLSSITAENILIENNVRRENRKKMIDVVAAQLILQSYLDSIKKQSGVNK